VLRLTNSEMKDWRRCRRKWYLGYYRRLRLLAGEDEPMSTTSIGNRVHDALAAYYNPAVKADPVAHAVESITADVARLPEKEADLLKETTLVVAMLEGYLEWLAETGADEDIVVEGTESVVEVRLVDGVNLLSKLDAPIRRGFDGAKLALEHKTVQAFDAVDVLKIDSQFLTEHLARFLHEMELGATPEEAHAQCHGILWNALRKVKRTAKATPPFYMRQDVPHNLDELRSHWRHVLAVAADIGAAERRLAAGESHQTVCYPNPTRDCKWDCPFFRVCAMADDGSDFEGALAGLYYEGDPLDRYKDAVPLGDEAVVQSVGGKKEDE
jgi:hypothetical protein